MNTMINLNVVLEKELELERQGFRRTSRYIGNGNRIVDEGWYRRNGNQLGTEEPYLGEVTQAAGISPRPIERRSILVRLFHLLRTDRQPACENC